jgi:alpha-L-fucosidase
MMMSSSALFLGCAVLLLMSSCAAAGGPESPTESAAVDRLAWFRDARFGLFIHWGIYSVPAGEWEG